MDCIHGLFENDHIGGRDESNAITFYIHDSALDNCVAIVCSCLEFQDEKIYMRMVQTLLTAATCTISVLHYSTFVAAVRTTYNIYLKAHDLGTRATATLYFTQILNLVFSRTEARAAEDSPSVPASSKYHLTIYPSGHTAVGSEGANSASSSNLLHVHLASS